MMSILKQQSANNKLKDVMQLKMIAISFSNGCYTEKTIILISHVGTI